jgi:hypothetical protein
MVLAMVLAPSVRAKIESWINEAPEFRKVETEPLASDAWEIRAIEDGQVVFADAEVDTDEPMLIRLAVWCEQHTKAPVKPLAKAASIPERRRMHGSTKG